MPENQTQQQQQQQTAAFKLSDDPAFLEMQKFMKGVATLLQTQGAALNDLRTKFEQSGQTPKPNGQGTGGDPNPDDEPDIETMSNSDFLGYVVKKVGGILDEKLGAVTKRLDGALNGLRTKDLQTEWKELKVKHKDFEDWTDEMNNLSKEHPTLTLAQLYSLAKSSNEEKAKQLATKYAEPKDEGNADASLTLFGGFRPSIKTGGEGNGGQREKVTLDQALDKAWEEAVTKTPALGRAEADVLD